MEFVVHEAEHGMAELRRYGQLRGGAGGNVMDEIPREGAKIIEKEVRHGLDGSNPFGLAPLADETIARKGNDRFLVEKGDLQGSVRATIADADARIGSNDPKVEWLKFGTSRVLPRPTFRMAGMRAEPKVQAMAQRKIAVSLERL